MRSLFYTLLLFGFFHASAQYTQLGSKISARDVEGFARQGWSVSLSADGQIALIGGINDNTLQGAAWIYVFNGNEFVQYGNKLIGSGAGETDFGDGPMQGSSVSLSADGKTALVGGSNDNKGKGATWVYTFNGRNYVQVGNKLVGNDAVSYLSAIYQGSSVSLSGDGKIALIGGSNDNSGMGAAWVYTFNGSNYVQLGNKLVGTGSITPDGTSIFQGISVSLSTDGKTALVGGDFDNGYEGATWVYTFNGTHFVQYGNKLVGTGSINYSWPGVGQGHWVSLSGDGTTALVGGYKDDSLRGATWIFTLNGNNFIQLGNKLVGTGALSGAQQGRVSLSSDGQTAGVGGNFDNLGFGAVWIYTFNGANFVQAGNKLIGTGAVNYGPDGPNQGSSVSISADGNVILFGGPEDNGYIGASWVFMKNIIPCISPSVTITSSNLEVCDGISATLVAYASGTSSFFTYSWYRNGTLVSSSFAAGYDSLSAYKAGSYFCVASNGCGSVTSSGINLTFMPKPTITGKALPETICFGDPVTITGSGAEPLYISNGIVNGIGFIPSVSGIYTLTGVGTNGCFTSSTVNVKVNMLPFVFLDLSPTGLCNTVGSVALSGGKPPNGIYEYSGSVIDKLDISKGGDYPIKYTYTDKNTCTNVALDTLSVLICLSICEKPNPPCTCTNTCPPPFKIYSTISPNGDDLNDVWYIDSLPVESVITILDNWGNKVFSSENYTNDWGGKSQNGSVLSAGIYYYIVDTKRKIFSGIVTIIK